MVARLLNQSSSSVLCLVVKKKRKEKKETEGIDSIIDDDVSWLGPAELGVALRCVALGARNCKGSGRRQQHCYRTFAAVGLGSY